MTNKSKAAIKWWNTKERIDKITLCLKYYEHTFFVDLSHDQIVHMWAQEIQPPNLVNDIIDLCITEDATEFEVWRKNLKDAEKEALHQTYYPNEKRLSIVDWAYIFSQETQESQEIAKHHEVTAAIYFVSKAGGLADKLSFIAGANWQAEQDKAEIEQLKEKIRIKDAALEVTRSLNLHLYEPGTVGERVKLQIMKALKA